MSRREYSDWLTAFVDYAKAFSETPEKFLYWSGVSAIATALERRVWIDQGRYMLYPNFFIVYVSEAGRVQKSTTIRSATSLLKQLKGVNIAPKSCTWEGFVQLLTQLHRADGELTLEGANTAVAPILVAASELSVFFDPEDKGKTSALVELWDCDDVFDRFTKMYQMETVEQPCVNLLAGTTPSWIRDSFDRWSREGGLVARTIFLYESKKRQLVPFPKRSQPKGADEIKAKLIRDLEYMQDLKGEFIIAEDAYAFGEKWYEEHNAKMEKAEDATGFADRKQAHILKLAMVISASRRESRLITLQDMQDATNQIDAVESDFARVFSVVDDRAEIRPYNEVKKVLAKNKTMEWSRLVGMLAGKYLLSEIERAVAAMVNADELAKSQKGTKIYLTFKGNDESPKA